MRVVGHSPVARFPASPDAVLLEDGSGISRSGSAAAGPWEACAEAEVPDGHWVMAVSPGALEAFPEGREAEWRARRAVELSREAAAVSGSDPIRAMTMLAAAAGLAGTSIAAIAEARASGRTPEEALERVRSRGR